MIFRNTINIAENRVGGLESTAAKERIQPEEPQRAINLVSIPQNFLKREISLTFLFLPSGTILVNVNYILPPENSQKTKLSAQERV